MNEGILKASLFLGFIIIVMVVMIVLIIIATIERRKFNNTSLPSLEDETVALPSLEESQESLFHLSDTEDALPDLGDEDTNQILQDAQEAQKSFGATAVNNSKRSIFSRKS